VVVADGYTEAISFLREFEEESILSFQADPEVERPRRSKSDLKGVLALSERHYFAYD